MTTFNIVTVSRVDAILVITDFLRNGARDLLTNSKTARQITSKSRFKMQIGGCPRQAANIDILFDPFWQKMAHTQKKNKHCANLKARYQPTDENWQEQIKNVAMYPLDRVSFFNWYTKLIDNWHCGNLYFIFRTFHMIQQTEWNTYA